MAQHGPKIASRRLHEGPQEGPKRAPKLVAVAVAVAVVVVAERTYHDGNVWSWGANLLMLPSAS
eukprot:3412616-Pyramimonas_sp.AAC.1